VGVIDQEFEGLRLELADGILLCRLTNGPRNAIDHAMHRQLELFFQELAREEDQPGVEVVVLTGSPGRYFSVGGDVDAMRRRAAGQEEESLGGLYTRGAARIIRALLSVPFPVVAAVNGDAVGLGANLALLSDVTVMTEGARIGDTHAKVGLVAGDGGAIIWPLLVGVNRAKELLMTGTLLSGTEAERIGLINHVFPEETFWESTMSIARRLAAMPAPAARWTKRTINQILWERLILVLDHGLAFEAVSAKGPEHLAAVEAFIGRRTAGSS
jgi:enoyl-CoA hydratase/carnithine racemase